MRNFITISKTEILLQAQEETSSIVLELYTYQQTKEATPQDFIHVSSHSMNLKWCSCIAGKLGFFLNASIWKPQLLRLSLPNLRM